MISEIPEMEVRRAKNSKFLRFCENFRDISKNPTKINPYPRDFRDLTDRNFFRILKSQYPLFWYCLNFSSGICESRIRDPGTFNLAQMKKIFSSLFSDTAICINFFILGGGDGDSHYADSEVFEDGQGPVYKF